MRLKGKIAIVTGAGQRPGLGMGNGRATAVLFAREGAKLILANRSIHSAEETRDHRLRYRLAYNGIEQMKPTAVATASRRIILNCEFDMANSFRPTPTMSRPSRSPSHHANLLSFELHDRNDLGAIPHRLEWRGLNGE